MDSEDDLPKIFKVQLQCMFKQKQRLNSTQYNLILIYTTLCFSVDEAAILNSQDWLVYYASSYLEETEKTSLEIEVPFFSSLDLLQWPLRISTLKSGCERVTEWCLAAGQGQPPHHTSVQKVCDTFRAPFREFAL